MFFLLQILCRRVKRRDMDVYLRWFRLHSAGVNLSIPPVAPADVPALYRPLIGTSTCGAKNISYRARYRPLAKSERKAQGRKGHTKTAEEHGANGDCIGARDVVGLLRLAQCMETAKVFCNYEDCKRKRVGEDFSAFVHTKTAKHFGNY